MLCQDCIVELADNISEESFKLLIIIGFFEDGASRLGIQKKWKEKYNESLSRALFTKHMIELESVMFVSRKKYNQTYVYGLTQEGSFILSHLE